MGKEAKTVLFSGFFDIIHSGHIRMILEARKHGDFLIVNVVPDKRAREKKGPGRPFMSAKERMFNIGHIKGVDQVVSVEARDNMTLPEYTRKILTEIHPDVIISSNDLLEIRNCCDELGVQEVYLQDIPGIDGLHSTDIINKINQ